MHSCRPDFPSVTVIFNFSLTVIYHATIWPKHVSGTYYGMFVSPTNSYVEALIPDVTVFGDGASER